jgi:hypothetical protein
MREVSDTREPRLQSTLRSQARCEPKLTHYSVSCQQNSESPSFFGICTGTTWPQSPSCNTAVSRQRKCALCAVAVSYDAFLSKRAYLATTLDISMARKPPTSHPDDDTLLALVDDEASTDTILDHVGSCNRCTERVAELRATRRLLQDVGAQQLHPQHDIAQRAVGRLRLRQMAIGNINEVFAAVRALFQGLAELFGGSPPPDVAEPLPRRDEGAPHG